MQHLPMDTLKLYDDIVLHILDVAGDDHDVAAVAIDSLQRLTDRFFGQLDARLKEAAPHRTINSIELAKDRCRYQS